MDLLFSGLGLVTLLLAGDALVRGAVNLSLRLGVPALIVSLTIVAFGTSAPELLVVVRAVAEDAPGLALGNVVGSNTANVLLVLGLPALVARLDLPDGETGRSYAFMLAATGLFMALTLHGPLTPVSGLILLGALALVLTSQLIEARSHRRRRAAVVELPEEVEGADPAMPGGRIALFLLLGLVGLPVGADLLVEGAVGVAREFGISETAIGLSLLAIGTSLPELATTVMAALRRQADVALGNVIGSNLFNLLAITGVASLFGPIAVAPSILGFDLWVMAGTSLMLLPFVMKWSTITRGWGVLLTGLYLVYVWIILV